MTDIPPLFADECVRGEIIEFLMSQGADVLSILDIAPSADDPEVIREAALRQRILVTADYDFGELRFRDGHPALGIVQIALDRLRTSHHGPIVHAALLVHRSDLVGNFVTIEPGRTRIRPLGSAE